MSKTLLDLQHELRKGNEQKLEQFIFQLKQTGTPIIESISESEDFVVTFIWHAMDPIENVVVYGSFPGVDITKNFLIQLENSTIWYKSFVAKKDIASTYYFSVNDCYGKDSMKRWENAIHDPFNPRQLCFPRYDDRPAKIGSILALPSAKLSTIEKQKNDVPSGIIETYTSKSEILNNERKIWAYTPAGYEKNGQTCHLLFVFDGRECTEMMDIPKVLDQLYFEGMIPPTIAIFIDNVDRDKELPCFLPFANYLTQELLPWVRQTYNVTNIPEETVIAGCSYGGLAASFVAMNYPTLFGRVLSQSGSYWWNPEETEDSQWLIDEYEKSEKRSIEFYIEVGKLEHQKDMINTNRKFKDVLTSKGYSVHYEEFAGGHDYLWWKSSFANGLQLLIGKKAPSQ